MKTDLFSVLFRDISWRTSAVFAMSTEPSKMLALLFNAEIDRRLAA